MSTILVVEDSQDNFDLIAEVLEDDHDLVHAETGPQGLARARENRPDLILLDMGLPDMDGWEVARRLKSNSSLADVPVIALTAHAMKGDRERCLDAGCDDYLEKPINLRRLVALVDRYVSQSAERAAG
jgi:CheY-like chemotaxis protein